ncbi:MAG: class IV adenylate cyclase [Acidobacteriia bacterium]|nr:class IV adenylate cyclase [Terriglobia bacterium]
MALPGRETEVKLRFASPAEAAARLLSIGARPERERQLEDNVLYDLRGDPLRSAGCLLRLRRSGGRAILTYKAPVPGEHRHKVRVEHETVVGDPDATARILEGLGLAPRYRYQKYRTTFALEGLEIALDETPIGCFVELEGEPDAIDRVAASLGYSESQYILATYRQLQEQRAAVLGIELGDLVFPTGSGNEAPR